jgi:hypothetical protein
MNKNYENLTIGVVGDADNFLKKCGLGATTETKVVLTRTRK